MHQPQPKAILPLANQTLKHTNTTLSAPAEVSVGSTITFETVTKDSDGHLVLGGRVIVFYNPNGTWTPLPGCQGFVYNGSFACTYAALQAGTLIVKAFYSGYVDQQANVAFESSSSPAFRIRILAIQTAISVQIFPENVSLNPQTLTANVQVSGSINPSSGPPPSGVLVILTFTSPQNLLIVRNVTTDSFGHFSYTLSINAIAGNSTDEYSVVASWNGDAQHTAGSSELAFFHVSKIVAQISISAGESRITRDLLLGASPVKVSGNVGPNLRNAELEVIVSGPVSTNETITAESDGSFVWVFTAVQDGTYLITVRYHGDGQHMPVSSSPVIVQVSPSYNTVAVVATIVAVGVAITLLKFGVLGTRVRNIRRPAKLGMEPRATGLTCPSCGFVNRQGASYCIKDRTPLKRGAISAKATRQLTCPSCGRKNRPNASFCRFCRAKLA